MAHIEKWINIEENGIYLVFGVTEENQLKFLHFSSKPFEGLNESELFMKEGF